MKRIILAVLLIVCAGFSAFAQNTDPIDLVLLLNTSSGMSSSYENVNDYITGAFLSEFLRVGDTFHLIAYSGSARLDVARRITEIGDVETIIGRMLLQYPIESGDNPGAAIAYAERYITSLPARPKKIVLVSTADSAMDNLVSAARQRLGSSNTTLDFVQVTPGQPLTNLPSSGRTAPRTAGTVTPVQGTTQGTTAAQGTTPVQGTTIVQDTTPVQGTSPVQDTTTAGDTTAEQDLSSPVISDTSQTTSAADQQSPVVPDRLSDARSGRALDLSMPAIIGIILLLLLLLGLIIFFASRRLGSSPNRVMARVASSRDEPMDDAPFVDHSKDLAEYAAMQARQRTTPYTDRHEKAEIKKPVVINPSGPLLLNLFVEDQSVAIGRRNIHSLKSGYSLSVGGGNSDFLIFLVPMPAGIGELRRNGTQLTFVPRRAKYFPDLGSSELRDCLNKTIRIISDKGYELRLRFEMYEDPLVALNRMLMSIKVPG